MKVFAAYRYAYTGERAATFLLQVITTDPAEREKDYDTEIAVNHLDNAFFSSASPSVASSDG